MTSSILIATDGSEAAAAAERFGAEFAARQTARVIGVCVVEDRFARGMSEDGLGVAPPPAEPMANYLKARAEATRLVKEENADRMRLYQEIARANGFPAKTAEVQAIFADSWRDQASKGWYLEAANGNWSAK